jgi:formate/nitrite transporter FocA (FNT family)
MMAAVDTAKLFELVWAALLAGVAVAVLFSVLILGATRATDLRREGRHGAATLYLGLSFAAGLACLAALAVGLTIIVSK